MSARSVYDLFKRGSELLEAGDFMAASIPLERARSLEPDKSSIREALGRAYFRSAASRRPREEFAAVVERYPVNDYAHFCLGRSLEKTGRTRRGPPPRRAGRRHAARPRRLPGLRGDRRRRRPACRPRGRATRGLHHQAEQAVHAALVERGHRACRRAPRCRASACSRSAPAGSGGSTRAASRGRGRRPRGARSPGRAAGRRRSAGPRRAGRRPAPRRAP